MQSLGVWEVDFILIVVVVILGARRLSLLGGASGRRSRGLRKGVGPAGPAQALAPSAPVTVVPVAQAPTGPAQAAASPGSLVSADADAPAPQRESDGENKCPSCNTINPDGQVFCGQCGTRLTRAA